MRIAMIFWKTCPDQIGASLVANLIFKSMAHKAELSEELQMADELLENARFDITDCLIMPPQPTICGRGIMSSGRPSGRPSVVL